MSLDISFISEETYFVFRAIFRRPYNLSHFPKHLIDLYKYNAYKALYMFITALPYLCRKKWEISHVSFCASDQLLRNNTRYAFERIVHCKIIRPIFARFSRMNHSDIFFFSSFPFLNRTNGTRTNDADCALYISQILAHFIYDATNTTKVVGMSSRAARA